MDDKPALPPLIHVELVNEGGIRRHSYDGLIAHLEQQMDPHLRENILLFILTGSRLYGTSTDESDWDYLCVTKTATKEARKSLACLKSGDELGFQTTKPHNLTDSNVYDMDATLEAYGLPTDKVPETLRFDVSFFELKVWSRLAFEQNLLPLEAQCLPKPFILYKAESFPKYQVDPAVLKTTASLLGGLKFANARPRLFEGNFAKAKRLGALGIRYVQFGIQLLESYRDNGGQAIITDWHSIAPVWKGLFQEHDPTNYPDFEAVFRPTFKACDTRIRAIMTYPTLYTVRECFASRWQALKPSFAKIDSLPHLQAPPSSWSDLLSKSAQEILFKLASGSAWDCIERYSVYPSIAKDASLLSLAISATAPIYDVPGLHELHGLVLSLPDWLVIGTTPRDGLLRDLVVLEKDDLAQEILMSDSLEISELYDGPRVAIFKHDGKTRVASYGGAIDGSERIASRTTEGRGPPRTFVAEQFTRMLKAPIDQCFDFSDPSRFYVSDMLSDCSRHITANHPERIVAAPSSSHPLPTGISALRMFTSLVEELKKLATFEARRNRLLEEVDLMNPFEQAGFVLRAGGKAIKLAARSYWSVRASVGHQNRVLAFNIPADHFEDESLLDACVYGFDREFAATFVQWKNEIDVHKQELQRLGEFLDKYKVEPFKCANRKMLAETVKSLPPPVKGIIFDWYGHQRVPVRDIIAALDIPELRQLKALMLEKDVPQQSS